MFPALAGGFLTTGPPRKSLFLSSSKRKTQRDRVEREVGGGIGMGNTCKSMTDSCQCMTKPTTIL